MRRRAKPGRLRAGLAMALLAAPGPAMAMAGTDLAVTVRGVASAQGHVLVAACTAETFLTESCPHAGRAPAAAGEVVVLLQGLPPGVYALQVFHDANDNHELDRDLLGRPREGIGFSRDAPIRLAPPAFDEAAIRVEGERAAAALTLRYPGD